MQQIFAYYRCVAANAELATDKIIANFAPDLNSETPQDAKLLEGFAKLTLAEFDTYLKTNQKTTNTLPDEVKKSYDLALAFYINANENDKKRILNSLIIDSENLTEFSLSLLQLIILLANKVKEIKKDPVLYNNYLIGSLIESEILNKEITKKNITWANDEDVLSDIMSQLLEDQEVKKYKQSTTHTLEQENEFVYYLVKSILFKNAKLNDFFETKHLNWHEDKVAVKDMLLDTIKEFAKTKNFALAPISKNWEDDKAFLVTLFNETIEQDLLLESYISPKLKNWDISRLTGTDSILIKQCITEMIHFSGIPVKVSMNEYIEISKRYSTPKSKTLINGVLDSLSQELVNKGVIRKSGRGLIDNK